MQTLSDLIQQAEQKCIASGLIGEARNGLYIVQVQILDRQVSKARPTFRTDVWRIEGSKAKKLKKEEWSKL
jgi:hypothetical protein